MRKHKIRELFWGLAFVAAAVFLVLNQLHLLTFHLGIGTIIWTIVFGVCLIESAVNKSLFGAIFSIAFLLIIYAKPLHIVKLVPWTILIAALLLYIGFTMIFKKSFWPKFYFGYKKDDSDQGDFTESSTSTIEGEDIVINQHLSSVSRYVHSQNLRRVTVNSSLGEAEIYLDQAKPAGAFITMDINASLGEVEIYIPKSWKIDSRRLDVTLGELEINGESTGGGPTLVLTGQSRLGELEIYYV
ncbi:hypothetical protein [Lactobacillus sp. M0390]|uniref:LiaF transmembrane domain-containing protein n=1 Tax=Lactobacillus sp. M0390 TaxID=2751026 RepID=UPI0018DE9944|nr:hypothetical protein [Lactobacillus sp. M0390]MBH9986061.1 hypothetical protein [Lactobacillus sp. M0390]